MTQAMWVTLALKIAVIAAEVTIIAFIAVYTYLAPWWRNDLGRTIVIKDILLAILGLLVILSLFFHFNRLTSNAAGWLSVTGYGGIAVVMADRIRVWIRSHNRRVDEDRAPQPDGSPGSLDGGK